jgi:hypothetical protein
MQLVFGPVHPSTMPLLPWIVKLLCNSIIVVPGAWVFGRIDLDFVISLRQRHGRGRKKEN